MISGEMVRIGYNLAKCFQSLVRHSFNLLDATASVLKYNRVDLVSFQYPGVHLLI